MDYKDTFSIDDNELWLLATSDFKPLNNKRLVSGSLDSKEKEVARITPEIKEATVNTRKLVHNKINESKDFIVGNFSNVDGAIARKLREGSYPIDFKLDLHGYTQDEAFEKLRYCMSTAYSIGKRCMLVITGKGERGGGVLREQLPKWLASPGFREYVLTISYAVAKHGGGGAFYVLLRKNR